VHRKPCPNGSRLREPEQLTLSGSHWENGDCESFNSKLREELLKGEIFSTLEEAKVLIESWHQHCDTVRPHSFLGYWPPAPDVRSMRPSWRQDRP